MYDIVHVVIVGTTRYEKTISNHFLDYYTMKDIEGRLQWSRRELENWADKITFTLFTHYNVY